MDTDKGVVVAAMTSVGDRVSARKTKSGSAEATRCFREFETSSSEQTRHKRSGVLTSRAWPMLNLNFLEHFFAGRFATGVAHRSKTSQNFGATCCRPLSLGMRPTCQ